MTYWQGRPRRIGRLAAMPLALAWVLTGLGPAGAAQNTAQATTCVSLTGTPPPTLTGGASFFQTAGVALVSPCNAWMVGGVAVSGGAKTLIEHWDGSSWSVVPSPSPGFNNVLSGVAATSASDAWGVGDEQNGSVIQTLIEHWDGTSWTQVSSPSPGSQTELTSVSAISAVNAWAVGHTGDSQAASQPLIEHWDGSSWSVVASPSPSPGPASGPNSLLSVTATSATDAWAVGTSAAGPFFEHWNGTAWSLVPAASSPDAGTALESVAATSASDAWAAGFGTDNQGLTVPVIEHWDGSTWSVVPAPTPGGSGSQADLLAVAASSTTDAWAVGEAFSASGDLDVALIEHWDGSSWSVVPTPRPGDISTARAVAVAPNRTGWVVGDIFDVSTGHPSGDFAFHVQCC